MKRYEKPEMQVREIRVIENLARLTATEAQAWVKENGAVATSVWTLGARVNS